MARDPWPDFAAFEAARYPEALRRPAAVQWWRRAREEYRSIEEFTAVATTLARSNAPLDLLAATSRLITDEVRHATLCGDMAVALMPGVEPEEVHPWSEEPAGWSLSPRDDRDAALAWAADVVVAACCIGETLSLPLYQTLSVLVTDPVPRSVVEQILRDERLHSTFGWLCLDWFREVLSAERWSWLQQRLSRHLAAYERGCSAYSIEELAGTEVVIEPPGPDAPPNLGLMPGRVYATVFYATLESEVFPRFEAAGLDPVAAWTARG